MRNSDWRRRFARSRVRTAKWLRLGTVPSVYGVRLRANWSDATFRFSATGAYGRYFSDFLSRQAGPFAFLDIGANQGLYSLIAVANPDCIATIAFEPVAAVAELMRENVALNKARNVTIHELAVCSHDGIGRMVVPRGHSGMATLRDVNPAAMDGGSTDVHCISAARLDMLVPTGPRYVVKIDVEGLEQVVIEEIARCAFFANVSHVFCEVDEKWIDAAALTARMRDLGFTSFEKVDGDKRHYDLMMAR